MNANVDISWKVKNKMYQQLLDFYPFEYPAKEGGNCNHFVSIFSLISLNFWWFIVFTYYKHILENSLLLEKCDAKLQHYISL